MIAIPIIVFLCVYILISIWVVRAASRASKKNGGRGWTGGLFAGFVMYNLVFWDLVPVLLMHKHYCEADAGFWVYQTPQSFIKEHSYLDGQKWDKASTRKWESKDIGVGHRISKTWLNPQFYVERTYERSFSHGITRTENRLVVKDTEEVLIKSVQFKRGESNLSLGASSVDDYKLWLALGDNECSDGASNYELSFKEYLNSFINYVGKQGE